MDNPDSNSSSRDTISNRTSGSPEDRGYSFNGRVVIGVGIIMIAVVASTTTTPNTLTPIGGLAGGGPV